MISTVLSHPSLRALLRPFAKDLLLHALLAICIVLSTIHRMPLKEYAGWVDWRAIYTLAGLILLTRGIEESGYLDHLGRLVINRLTHERSLALFLVASTALLSTVLTNDIALFITVPLTLGLRNLAGLPIGRLVIFEAMAANAGSLLTPIGNPQNILLWQTSHLSFWAFTWQMAPLAGAVVGVLLLLTMLAFPDQRIHAELPDHAVSWHSRLLSSCVILYLAFVAAVEFGYPGWGLLVLLIAIGLLCRPLLFDVDWSLIGVFVLMFIDIHLFTDLPWVQQWVGGVAHMSQPMLFMSSLISSQFISNVPATILLLKYTAASKTIAYAVNAGGYGFVLGSLANLIALRMLDERGKWLRFHLYSLPFLVVVATLAYCLQAT
jgi:Na+/H+ antiporter NhaD/arsenite permease-like protein